MNGSDTYLDINNSHLRVTSGNVYASSFNLDQISIVASANTATTVNFNNDTKAFNAVSNIEVGTANLFVDTTTSRVGIGTDAPAHTLDVHGSANIGTITTTDINVTGNLTVLGTTTTLDTVNLSVKDPIIEIGKDNTSAPVVDLGLIMTRPATTSNVAIIFDENTDTLEIGYTQSNASDTDITMRTAATEPLSVNVNGTISGNGSGLTALNATNITTGTLDRNTTGSAAKLTAAVAIGGVDFDGSAAIILPGVDTAGTQDTSGNAATATQWANGRTIAVTGGVTGTTSAFDGSGDATLVTTLADLDAAKIATGTLPVVRGGTGTTTSTGTGSVVLSAAPAFTGDVTFDTDTLKIDSTNNRVGIGTTIPQTSLQIKDETDTTGTGDGFITGLTANSGNRKPTECLRLQGKYHAAGSGALLRFTNFHASGSNPSNDEYNLGGIAGFDYSSQWGGGLCFYTAPNTANGGDLTARMVIDSSGYIGFGTASPLSRMHHKQPADQSYLSATLGSYQNGLVLERSGSSDRWCFAHDDLGSMCFFYNITRKGYLLASGTDSNVNFTGQHRTFIKDVPFTQAEELKGLIVSADINKYVKMSGGIEAGSNAITVNESLPIVSISTKVKDKKCFGVISASEDPEKRQEQHGNFVSDQDKESGDTRVYINSVGEGAIWVTNINGSLESGDYITTSNVAGYGQKQDSDSLKNYTVAKITMDCDFEPVTQPIQQIKKELEDVNYWVKTTYENVSEEEYSNLIEEKRRTITETVYTNEDGETFTEQNEQSTYTELTQTLYQQIKKEESKTDQEGYELKVRQELVNVLDEHGQIQWEDHPTETEKAYKIRYLDADGNITDEANAVHKAAFVGCTYHCG